MAAEPALRTRYARAARQPRSRETLARIVTAGESLFAERGYDGASVGDIAKKAKCSVGAFYARFPDKESLFHHIHQRHCGILVETARRAEDDALAEATSLEDVVKRIVAAQFSFASKRRALTRVFIQRSGEDSAFHARYAASWGEAAACYRRMLGTYASDIGAKDPAAGIDFVIRMVHAMWANEVLHHGRLEIVDSDSAEADKKRLVDTCFAYLTAS